MEPALLVPGLQTLIRSCQLQIAKPSRKSIESQPAKPVLPKIFLTDADLECFWCWLALSLEPPFRDAFLLGGEFSSQGAIDALAGSPCQKLHWPGISGKLSMHIAMVPYCLQGVLLKFARAFCISGAYKTVVRARQNCVDAARQQLDRMMDALAPQNWQVSKPPKLFRAYNRP